MAQARWKNLRGVKRVQAEFKQLSRRISSENGRDFIRDLEVVGDNMHKWRFKLNNFDADLEGGRQLNADLQQLKARFGQDFLLMEVEFPNDYPHQPFFIRVVSPRCGMYTGHVTAGGSICMEALTLSGTEGSWQPDFSVEGLLNMIMLNMIDCEKVLVQTATGPGGLSGPLRIDFNCRDPTVGYSPTEAKAAFARTLENHKRMGWNNGSNAVGAGAAAAGAAAAAGYNAGAAFGAGQHNRLAALAALGSGAGSSRAIGPGHFGFPRALALPNAAGAAAASQQQRIKMRLPQGKPAGQDDPGAAGAPSAAAAAAAGAGSTVFERPAAAAAAAGAIVAQRRQAKAAAAAAAGADLPRRQQAAAAAAAGTARPNRPQVAAVVDLVDSDDSDIVIATPPQSPSTGATPVAGQAALKAVGWSSGQQRRTRQPPQQQQPPQPHRQHAGTSSDNVQRVNLVDSDDDDEVVQIVSSRPPPSTMPAYKLRSSSGLAGNAGADLHGNRGHNRAAAPTARKRAIAAAAAAQTPPAAGQQQQQQDRSKRVRLTPLSGLNNNMHVAAAAAATGTASHQRNAGAAADTGPVRQRQQQQLAAAAAAATGGAKVSVELEYPQHWDYSEPTTKDTVRLVELPLPKHGRSAGVSQWAGLLQAYGHSFIGGALTPLQQAAVDAQLSAEDVQMLTGQGLSVDDAVAALLMAEPIGDADDALLKATVYMDVGGAAQAWRDQQPHQERPQEQEQQVMLDEVEQVLAMMEKGGLNTIRQKVVRIERIQNARRWKRYQIFRQELAEARGEDGVNERLLFHGTSPSTALQIVQSGFDFRLSAYTSAYGTGTYFADRSDTALSYCHKVDGVTGPLAFGPGPLGFPPPPMPGLNLPFMRAMLNMPAGVPGRTKKASKKAKAPPPFNQAAQQQGSAGLFRMLVARVALGQQTTGVSGMRKPPDGFDSVNSGSAPPTGVGGNSRHRSSKQQQQQYFCHVVFDNDQAYPEYLVTFQR